MPHDFGLFQARIGYEDYLARPPTSNLGGFGLLPQLHVLFLGARVGDLI